jgi:hypothetical protein
MSDGPEDRVTEQATGVGYAEPATLLAERAWMRRVRVTRAAGVARVVRRLGCAAFAIALLHCGGDDNSGGPGGDQDANGPVSDAAANGNDGGGEAAVDGNVPDSTTAPGLDAGDAGKGALDATADAGPDATVGADAGVGADTGVGSADAGPDVTVGTTDDAGDGAASGDGDMDAADAADTALPPLVCGSQTCARTEFCAAFGNDAGANGTSDAGDDGASDGGAGDGGSVTLSCTPGVFGNICDNATATLFYDPYAADNEAANVIGTGLASACGMTIDAPDAAPFNPASGEPMTGIGNLCVIGGGSYGQPATAYLDNNSLTDVFLSGGNDEAGVFDLFFTDRSNPENPVNVAAAPYSPTATNTDYFLIELATDPASGSLCLDVIGLSYQGTAAGAYYLANNLLGNGAFQGSTKSWYVYYWASSNDGGTVSDADTFTLVASGP